MTEPVVVYVGEGVKLSVLNATGSVFRVTASGIEGSGEIDILLEITPATDQVIDDRKIGDTVNALRDIAVEYRNAQQLRERIAHVIVPLLKRQAECKQCDAKQAKIDALMLEYCPNEMTKEQMATWADHQLAVPYCVGEFWSSSNPDKKVLCVAVGEDIAKFEKHASFIRWVGPNAKKSLTDNAVPEGTMTLVKVTDEEERAMQALYRESDAHEEAQLQSTNELQAAMWRDFVSLQSGDVQLMCKEAEEYRKLKAMPDEPVAYTTHDNLAALKSGCALISVFSPACKRGNQVALYTSPQPPAQLAGASEVGYEIVQDDMVVASAWGANAETEIKHYAAQYSQDGPIEVYKVTKQIVSLKEAGKQ